MRSDELCLILLLQWSPAVSNSRSQPILSTLWLQLYALTANASVTAWRSRLQNDLLCVERDVKLYRPTHSLREGVCQNLIRGGSTRLWHRYSRRLHWTNTIWITITVQACHLEHVFHTGVFCAPAITFSGSGKCRPAAVASSWPADFRHSGHKILTVHAMRSPCRWRQSYLLTATLYNNKHLYWRHR